MNNQQKLFSTLLISVAISACGGGGGGGSSPPAQTINETNLVEVSQLSYSSGLLLYAFEGLAVLNGVQFQVAKPAFDLKSISKLQALEALQTEFLPAIVAGVVTQQTLSCSVSGTVTLTADDADGDGVPSAGDKGTFVYSNCVTGTTGGNITRNGTVTTTFTKLIGIIDPANAYEAGLEMVFQNLAMGLSGTTGTLNGSLATNTVNDPAGISTNQTIVPSFSIAVGSGSSSYTNYLLDDSLDNVTKAYSNRAQGTFAVSGLGTFNLSTPTPFQGVGNGNPSVGMLIIAAPDSTALVSAIDVLNARLDLDKNNNGTIDYTQSVPWNALSFL